MESKAVCVCLGVCLVLCLQLTLSAAAPRHQRHHNRHNDIDEEEVKLTLVLNKDGSLTAPLDDDAAAFVDPSPFISERSSRQKRDASAPMSGADLVDMALPEEAGLSASERRTRRSAAWWMHAVVQLCNNNRRMCRRIEVDEGSLHMRIRLEEF